MYRRSGALEDPWLSLSDHSSAIDDGDILYGANSFGGRHTTTLTNHDGASVYIRYVTWAHWDSTLICDFTSSTLIH